MSDQQKPINVIQLDRHMAITKNTDDSLQWLSPLEEPFHVAGFAWFKQEKKYRRLPSSSDEVIPVAVDSLANCTAGGQIRFRTNTSSLAIRVKLRDAANMYHMAPTGQCGFDCYLGEPGEQRFLTSARFDHTQAEYEAIIFKIETKRELCITLNFPLYQGVEEVFIGIDADASVSSPPEYASNKPVVIYGTSITQGGCATRPGMAYSNILSRSIPLEFINLGFSGNGKGEAELAHIIADIPDPALLVLDYEANSGTVEAISATLPVFIDILRKRHPEVPILVVSNIRYAGDSFYEATLKLHTDRREIQRSKVERLRASGDQNIHFLNGFTLLGDEDAEECTVDGNHPTDLGFMRMAKALEPTFKELLKKLL